MSDWKSDYGVSDQGAWNAGVYGTPNSTYDIARAQAETARLQLQASLPPSLPTPDYTTPTFPSYAPPPAGQAYYPTSSTGSSTGCLKALLVIGVLAVFALLRPTFIAPGNIHGMLMSASIAALMFLGLTWLIAAGEIDVSFMSVAALANMVVAGLVQAGAGRGEGLGRHLRYAGEGALVICNSGDVGSHDPFRKSAKRERNHP